MNEQRVYTHIDTDDSVLSLHDCYANSIQFGNSILSFYFQNGFWVTPSHHANNYGETVRTDSSQVDYHLDDDVSIYVFRKNIFGKTIRIEWTLEELVRFINNNTFSLEFLYQYKSHSEQLLKCWLHFDREPHHYECQIEIPTSKVLYRWNNLCYDKTWQIKTF